ncbi:MAG: hypothetical protein GC171_13750 [Terrimonas sp.]|nr:hypothetical protein [Terrimonas sp.]
MEPSQQPPAEQAASTVSSPGLFGTKLPVSASLIIGVLVFLMPFVNIKCGNMSFKEVTGLELATGFEIKDPGNQHSMFGDMGNSNMNMGTNKKSTKDPNLFALAALGMGILAAILSFMSFKGRSVLTLLLGSATVVALVALMIDVKSQIRTDVPSSSGNNNGFNLDMGDSMKIVAEFTPWFYIAVFCFAAAAFFSYRFMKSK